MKIWLFLGIIILGMGACQDQERVFPDNTYQAVYFPVQLPLRTLSLGEDRIDNSLDREYKFDIGVSIGGMYQNNKRWTVDYIVDLSLTDSVYTNAAPVQKIKHLPEEYYTMSPMHTAIIPEGSFNGMIRIQMDEAFFDDPLAISGIYVIPLRITDSSADSILTGMPLFPDADLRDQAHWEVGMKPRDWVMFGIKYVNAYHGWYLHRGREIRTITDTGTPVDTVIFRHKYIERDALIKLTTSGKRSVTTNRVGNKTGINYSMELEFDNDWGKTGNVTIKPIEGIPYAVTGAGKYFEKAESTEQWSHLTWQCMYLEYSYEDGIYTHQINDTLVFRDRDIKYEELSIKIND